MICVFKHSQSHCHIFKRLHDFFLCMMDAIINFEQKTFHIYLCDYRLVTKSIVLGAHLMRW